MSQFARQAAFLNRFQRSSVSVRFDSYYLDLEDENPNESDAASIADGVQSDVAMKYFTDLSDIELESATDYMDEKVIRLARQLELVIKAIPIASEINAKNCQLFGLGTQFIARGMQHTPFLKRLDLSRNGIGDAGAR